METLDRLASPFLRRHRVAALLVALGAVGVATLGVLLYAAWTDAPQILAVELAGRATSAGRLYGVDHYVAGREAAYGHALGIDYLLIASYGLALIAAALLGRALAVTAAARRIATLAGWAAMAAVLCDVLENVLLVPVVERHTAAEDGFAVAAQAFSLTKWTLLAPVVVVAVVAIVTTLWRAVTPSARGLAATELDLPVGRPDPLPAHLTNSPAVTRAAWRFANKLPGTRPVQDDMSGFCVSGGGIRSATFALGALDSLRGALLESRYLVSVSGGGYAAGAMLLALQPLRDQGASAQAGLRAASVATPADVYRGGSSELDYTRKHGKYLAEGAAEWLQALGHVLRGVVVNMLTIGLLVLLVGRVIAHLYADFPGDLFHQGAWPPATGAVWAVGALAALGLLSWVAAVWIEPAVRPLRRALGSLGRATVALAALILLALIGLPSLAVLASLAIDRHDAVAAAVSQAVSIAGGYLATLVALAKRRSTGTGSDGSGASLLQKGRGLLGTLVVYLGLAAVVAGLLLLLGIVFAATGPLGARSAWAPGLREWHLTLLVLVALAFFATVDQVRWSLHPFYKQRLATAFSVRRVGTWLAAPGQATGAAGAPAAAPSGPPSAVNAVPYEFGAETTALHEYAAQTAAATEPGGFPQVIFSCAAHVSDRRVTLPGRRVVPWTMSSDFIGSPMIGWANTRAVFDAAPRLLSWDLTVQAAQALSGAAIASQMGRADRAYAKLLTISNARLGSWLINPAYLPQSAVPAGEAWRRPRIPHRRYLATLARELLGSYPADGPLVFVSDGGHYENLGLVELLRHRCRTVYCLDASGDRPDLASTLADAIELAYEELGVVLELDAPGSLGAAAPGSATAPDALLEDLAGRLAQSCVVTGAIHYPDLGPGLPALRGRFVLGKAVLQADMPFDVLAHAARNPSFPNDSTADQWYDFARFDAYHALGRFVGERTREAMAALIAQETQGGQ